MESQEIGWREGEELIDHLATASRAADQSLCSRKLYTAYGQSCRAAMVSAERVSQSRELARSASGVIHQSQDLSAPDMVSSAFSGDSNDPVLVQLAGSPAKCTVTARL